MGFIGNQSPFIVKNVPANTPSLLASFTFQGSTANSFYIPTGFFVCCVSGTVDFLVRLFFNGQQIEPAHAARVLIADRSIDAPNSLNNISMTTGSVLQIYVVHFDTTKNHNFEGKIYGSGVS